MVRTRAYSSKEEAAEAWNTWAGTIKYITQDQYNRLNDSIQRDYPIENGKLKLPDGENAFGDIIVEANGEFESPWPRIYLSDYAHSEHGLYGGDTMFDVYLYRARWRMIEKDHPRLKRILLDIFQNNDRENLVLNKQLRKWNKVLKGTGFPAFEEDDLRGVDISGLTIGNNHSPVYLRKVDLSYSECHLTTICGNLYNAKFIGAKGCQIDLRNCTCHGVAFQGAYFPQGLFTNADCGYCNFDSALLSHCCFNGANCASSNFSNALLWRTSFLSFTDMEKNTTTFSDLTNIIWNSDTGFRETVFNQFLAQQNPKLFRHIEETTKATGFSEEVISSVELKPGIFGVSIDLKKFLGAIISKIKQIRK